MARTERSDVTRRQLCLAAEMLVATQGLANVTLRKVALAAGQKNNASVSYHFGSIDDLLRAVVEMRLRESEGERERMIAESGRTVAELDAFSAWQCLARPLLELADEAVPHAHVRFMTGMSAAGLLSDPFDERVARPESPTITALLRRLHQHLAHLPSQIGRARIALCGMMFWNAVALHDVHALGRPGAGDLDALLADVEGHVRHILNAPGAG